MKEAVLMGRQQLVVRETDAPAVEPGGVLVRVRNCGICGSDLHFYRGEFPSPPNLRMGHEISGEVAAVGEGVSGIEPGRRVALEPVAVCRECDFCRTGRYQLCPERKFLGTMLPGGLAEYLHVPAYMVHPLPDAVEFDVGALCEPLAVAVHGLRLVNVSIGERVAVLGAGTIGLMSLIAAQAMGASDVFVTARYPQQADAARALGATAVVDADEDAVANLLAAFGGRPPDVVVETVGGHADTLNEAIALAAPGGRVSVLGIFTGRVSVNMTSALLKEVTLLGGITYGRPGARSDFEVAMEIASKRAGDMRRLITHRVSLDDIERGFATAADKSAGSIKVTVEVGG
jgi:2-desacetyl-2-hydroxyethyl bacteriochlorophyllide A dehydrogenase